MPKFDKVKDSGTREEFATGSKRDSRKGKGRYDLISPFGLKRLAIHYENGADKYGSHNWTKGQPICRYLDSALRHGFCYLSGMRDEDHLAAMAWNAFAAIHTEECIQLGVLPPELDDTISFMSREDFHKTLERYEKIFNQTKRQIKTSKKMKGKKNASKRNSRRS